MAALRIAILVAFVGQASSLVVRPTARQLGRVRMPAARHATPDPLSEGERASFDVRNMTAAIEPLIQKIAEYRTASFDEEEAVARREEIIELYQRLFVPAAGFALANVGVYLAFILAAYGVLQLGEVGFDDASNWLLHATDNAPWVASTVGRLDPKLGNLAIALLAAELAAPLIVVASLALSSPATNSLRSFLNARGLDSRGASEKLERMINAAKR